MTNLRISLIHPTSNPSSRNAAIALAEAGMLKNIITSFAYNPKRKIERLLEKIPGSNNIVRELGRRTWIPPDGVCLNAYPREEIIRMLLVKSGLSHCLGWGSLGPIDWVYSSLDRKVAHYHLENIDAVYAYEDGAAATFETAKQQGIICLYELPILFYRTSRQIQAQEAELFPDLAPALQAVKEPPQKIERKEKEIQLADRIFVPSSFVKESLLSAGIAPEKITVIPYGSPINYFQPQAKTDRTFRAIFIGRLSPRKGVHYLLQAWQELKLSEAELLFVGSNWFPDGWLDRYCDDFSHIPSVPHNTLNQYYSSGDVLVLPSLVEGLSLVQLEAMACGIPIITTYNAGGTDIITDGVEGFIIPIRDVEALKEKLEWCYEHPEELAQMGKAARKKAEQLTWDLYRQRLANQVSKILTSQQNVAVGGIK